MWLLNYGWSSDSRKLSSSSYVIRPLFIVCRRLEIVCCRIARAKLRVYLHNFRIYERQVFPQRASQFSKCSETCWIVCTPYARTSPSGIKAENLIGITRRVVDLHVCLNISSSRFVLSGTRVFNRDIGRSKNELRIRPSLLRGRNLFLPHIKMYSLSFRES